MALGFLEWREIDYEEKIYKAPLLLVPMTIGRTSISQPFTVSWNGDEVRSNLSLIYKLREQGVEIPDFEEFESEQDLISYFKQIESIIGKKSDWKITKEIYLSSFNFKKFVMFKDLNLSNWSQIENNSIIDLLDVQDVDEFLDGDLDLNSLDSNEIFNVVDADSSQLAVLQEAKNGKNLVVEGPPGTGKSQTIVNLIAELMASGQKILFVSEKKAALDVVKTRLDGVGLGGGCLELHGKNSNKKEFLNELERTLNLKYPETKDMSDFQNLDDIKQELNQYVETLHNIYKDTELTPFQLIGMYEYHSQKLINNNQEIIKLNIDDVSKLTKDERGKILKQLGEIVKYYDLVSPVLNNIWRNTSPEHLTSPDIKKLEDQLNDLSDNLSRYDELDTNIHELIGVGKLNTLNNEILMSNAEILKPNLKLLKEEDLESLIGDIDTFQNKMGNMNIDVLDLDLDSLKYEIDTLLDNINDLNINIDIVDKEDFKSMSVDFKSNKDIIEESNLEKALNNPNLELEFNEFKSKRNSFFLKKALDGNFKRIKNNFKSYYDYDVSDDQIESDFEKIITANNDLTKLRNKILAYSKSETNDEKIIIESEKLLSWASELDTIKSKLSSYKVSVQKNSMHEKINTLIELKELLQHIESMDDVGNYYFGDDWRLHKSDTKILKEKLNNIQQFKKCYEASYFNDTTIKFIESNDFNTLNNYLNDLSEVKRKIINQYNDINNTLHFENELLINDISSANVHDMKNIIDSLLNNIENLNDYRLFTKYCNEYSTNYTKELIEYINQDKIKSYLVSNLFYYNIANIALIDIFTNEQILDEFNVKVHEEKLSKFKKLDKSVIIFNRYRICEILANNRPNINVQTSASSSLGILKKEMSKKTKIKPIRKLLTETSDVISSIKPCFMMSPLSIAQYLDPGVFESYFDYVIFDEASQVKVEDSIGAMLRGNRYIVMGDTKQLPPTNFFEKEVDIDEEDEEEGFADNIESILHLCKNSFETKMLKWHYRSRHESLISVSNQEFYNNKLYVFPSPTKESEDLGLKFKYNPTTTYDRGGGRNNIKEAEEVIEYAFKCFEKYGTSRSLGIGTFSSSQQNTIMDILEKKLKDKPELEHFFNENGEEGFFVKNLENIQGDERDIILISIGYGKDLNKKLSLSFGPLNREGGERRLNVLITRAKKQCVVFSNFKSSEMHTYEKTPRGVEALKTFLYYAENGEFPENYHTGEDFDSPFEESVYNFLTDEGYTVEKQVGCAGYKIDLAIVDKDNANRYVLAIECDGATYHSSPLARDRDRLRQEVLEGLGWRFHRIWSTDWYHVNKSAKQRLLDAVEDAMKNKDNKKIAEEFETNFEHNVTFKTNEDKQQEELDKYFEDYTYYEYFKNISKEDFLEELVKTKGYIESPNYVLKELIKTEGPVHIEDIYDNTKKLYNKKATKKFKNLINNELQNLVFYVERDNEFYFPKNYDWDNMKVRRRKSPKIERIHQKELEKSIIYTLKLQYSSPKEDLIKIASTHLGFKSARSNLKEKFGIIITNMISNGILIEENGTINLKEN